MVNIQPGIEYGYELEDLKVHTDEKESNRALVRKLYLILMSEIVKSEYSVHLKFALKFFSTASCVYTFQKMIELLGVLIVIDDKIYIADSKTRCWKKMSKNNELIAVLREMLEKIYGISFDNLELKGFNMNSKISTLISNIKISKKFKIEREVFEEKIVESANRINFKNGCYNMETKSFKDVNDEKLFFDSYIDAEYNRDIRNELSYFHKKAQNTYDLSTKDEYNKMLLNIMGKKYIAPNFYHFFNTSLKGDVDKLMQFGQHLVYSITTKTDTTKAKQVLLMFGGHDVGKSCLIDLCSSYFPIELVSHLAPTGFKNAAVRSKLFTVKLNTTHETSSERNLPVSEFNKTVWINKDEAVSNGKIYRGNYLQLHQIYAANDFFKAKEQYNPKDYFPKINLLLIDGTHKAEERILNLSDKLIAEKNAIITFFLNAEFLIEINGKASFLTVYDLLKKNKFIFIEKEDAIEFKEMKQVEYDLDRARAEQKKSEKKLELHDYGLNLFIEETIKPYTFDKEFLNRVRDNCLEDAIREIAKEVDDDYKILFDDLYKKYKNFCEEKILKSYTKSSFKKELNENYFKPNIIIESDLKKSSDDIDYENIYKGKIKNNNTIYLYKKFKNKKTGDNKIGYIGFKVEY